MSRAQNTILIVAVHALITALLFYFDAAWQMTILSTGGNQAPPLMTVLQIVLMVLALPVLLPLLYIGDAYFSYDPFHGIGLLSILVLMILNSTLAVLMVNKGRRLLTKLDDG